MSGIQTTCEAVNIAKLRIKYGETYTLSEWLNNPHNMYVGRVNTRIGAPNSKFKNPFSVNKVKLGKIKIPDFVDRSISDWERNAVLAIYAMYAFTGDTGAKVVKDFKPYNDINELRGFNLGCWCHPELCHAHVLIMMVDNEVSQWLVDNLPESSVTFLQQIWDRIIVPGIEHREFNVTYNNATSSNATLSALPINVNYNFSTNTNIPVFTVPAFSNTPLVGLDVVDVVNVVDTMFTTSVPSTSVPSTSVPSTSSNVTSRGKVALGRLRSRFDKSDKSKLHPSMDNYTRVNVTSSGKGLYKQLSPMIIGPMIIIEPVIDIQYYPTGIQPGYRPVTNELANKYGYIGNEYGYQVISSKNFENFWQYSKIQNIDVTTDNIVKPEYFERKVKGFADIKGHRRVIPKKKGHPVAALHNGTVMGYLESRKTIYCPYYSHLAKLTPAYQELERLISSGKNVLIVGYDSRNFIEVVDEYSNGISNNYVEVTQESMLREINDTSQPFGHEMVLACMLTGLSPWSI